MITLVLGTVVPWIVVAVGCWLLRRVVRQHRHILARLDSINQNLNRVNGTLERRHMKDSLARYLEQHRTPEPPPPSGLPVGTPAPDFDLPDLSGQQHKLEEFRGRKLLLVFLNPRCGPCLELVPELARLPVDGADGQPVPVLITSDSAEANRHVVEEHHLRCPVLLDAKGAIGALYKMSGTPSGYLIDEHGTFVSPLATGGVALLALVGTATKAKGKANKGLAASRINRDGLKAGTPAPDFRLPQLDGGELALAELRGQTVLLVFSDPECGPCQALAPQLEQLQRRQPDLKLVMISRRDEDANRKKVAELGITFPVLLQKEWEISKLYGIFATPVAYLIDATGVIVHDVAKGADAILELVNAPSSTAAGTFLARAA